MSWRPVEGESMWTSRGAGGPALTAARARTRRLVVMLGCRSAVGAGWYGTECVAPQGFSGVDGPFRSGSNTCTMGCMVGTGGDELEAELAVVCGRLNVASARLVGLVAEALESEVWAGAGIRSPEHWLVLRAGLSPGRARQVVLMARRVRDLPVVMGAFGAGALSVDQVAVVARHAPSHVEASVAELAVSASVPQLGRVLSRYAFDPPTGADPEPDAEPGAGVDPPS